MEEKDTREEEMKELEKLRKMRRNWLASTHALDARVEELEHKIAHPPFDMEKAVMKRQLETAARNIASMTDQIHQAYHTDRSTINWRNCDRGVCASAGYMMEQCGYNKLFEKIERT